MPTHRRAILRPVIRLRRVTRRHTRSRRPSSSRAAGLRSWKDGNNSNRKLSLLFSPTSPPRSSREAHDSKFYLFCAAPRRRTIYKPAAVRCSLRWHRLVWFFLQLGCSVLLLPFGSMLLITGFRGRGKRMISSPWQKHRLSFFFFTSIEVQLLQFSFFFLSCKAGILDAFANLSIWMNNYSKGCNFIWQVVIQITFQLGCLIGLETPRKIIIIFFIKKERKISQFTDLKSSPGKKTQNGPILVSLFEFCR